MVRTEPIFKEIYRREREKIAVNFTALVTLTSQKSEKKNRVSGLMRHTSAQLARGPKTLGSLHLLSPTNYLIVTRDNDLLMVCI